MTVKQGFGVWGGGGGVLGGGLGKRKTILPKKTRALISFHHFIF